MTIENTEAEAKMRELTILKEILSRAREDCEEQYRSCFRFIGRGSFKSERFEFF